MSVTLTQNPATYSFARTLADYDLRHSASEFPETPSQPNERPDPEGTSQNPPGWEDGFRRVPVYRPIDRDIDVAYRSTYQNNIERAFLANMFTGIRIVAGINRVWRSTGGKINNSYFRWAIGGEF